MWLFALLAAVAVWPEGHERELNSNFRFEARFERGELAPMLKVVAPYPYKAYLNGEFVGWGPARAAKGYYRPDEWTLGSAKAGENVLEIYISAYNQGASYCNVDNPAFLQAEVMSGSKTVAMTGRDFKAYTTARRRKVSRYSFQRTFGEVWKVPGGRGEEVKLGTREVEIKLLPKRSATPDFAMHGPFSIVRSYPVRYDREKEVKSIDFIEGEVPGQPIYYKGAKVFPKGELEANLWDEMQRLVEDERGTDGRATVFDSGTIGTGFLRAKVKCTKPGRLYALFDELLGENGDVDSARYHVGNAVRWDIEKEGEYELETFEPYAMRAVRFVMLGGEGTVKGVELREVKSPSAKGRRYEGEDKELGMIFEAARETFAQNAVDVFTDCPGRERAGWLCDSWFTARASEFFTGSTALEKQFLENFLYAENYGPQEKGSFPMCYPAEHTNGRFIPNWSFWLVLELGEYLERSGDKELVGAFEKKVMGMLEMFARYENAEGLLEKLPGWIFVEWSRANKLVNDVNYPSNMTYARVLEVAAELYGRPELKAKAERVKAEVMKQSWTGEWFCDNAVRQKDGKLKLSGECTEVCQYYAFYFGLVTAESHPQLWKRLVEDFGPERKSTGKWEKIWPANAFIGNYMRLELLSKAGMGEKVLEDVKGYFLKMAKATGTLWEYDSPRASCCHGFASYVAVLIDRHVKKGAKAEFPKVGEARAITKGPKEHFLANYFAINAWSDDNRYVLALETEITGRLPKEGERCVIGVVDLEKGNEFIPVSTTACWNFQEAAMGHWLDNETILFNDVREGKFVTVVMKWKERREERILPRPVAAVSEDRTWAVSINYARLYLTRPDYGYAGAGQDALEGEEWPEGDGLWAMDLKTGESKLIVSVAEGRAMMPEVEAEEGKAGHPLSYYCHTVISKDGEKVFFLARSVRWYDKESHEASKHVTTSFTVNRDGGELRRCFPEGWGGSHFNWAPDGSHRMLVTTPVKGNVWPSLIEFEVGREAARRRIGAGALDQDWHCVYSPDGKFMSGEAYPNGNGDRCWVMVRLEDGAEMPIGAYRVPKEYRSAYWRCDLHARWRRDGRQLAFNSVHGGSRQIWVRDVATGR